MSNPFDKLKVLLRCKKCGAKNPDPKTKLCKKCELVKLIKDQERDQCLDV